MNDETLVAALLSRDADARLGIALACINSIDPVYDEPPDWESFFAQMTPLHVESLDGWIAKNDLSEYY